MSFPSTRKEIREGLGFKNSKTDKEMYKKFFLCKNGTSRSCCSIVVPKNNELVYWNFYQYNSDIKDVIARLIPLFNGGVFEDRYFYTFLKKGEYFYLTNKDYEDEETIFKILNSRFQNSSNLIPQYSQWYIEVNFSDIKDRIENGVINPIHWEQL